MKISIALPQYRPDFEAALEFATDGTTEWEQSSSDEEIIRAAVMHVDAAARMIREAFELEQEAFPEDAVIKVSPTEVAILATYLALEDLEDWGEWNHEHFMDELIREKKRLIAYLRKRDEWLSQDA